MKYLIARNLFLLAIAVSLLACASTNAEAADYYGGITTLPYAFQTQTGADDAVQHLFIYEYADIHAENFGAEGLSLHFAGWGRYDAKESFDDPGVNGEEAQEPDQPGDADLTSAYLRWRGIDGLVDVHLGRHFISAGVTVENMDCIDLILKPFRGFALQAFGGAPTFSKIGQRDGDLGAGGRASYRYYQYLELGASYHYFLEDEEFDRQNIGGDFFIAPSQYLDLIGHVFYDVLFREVYDAAAHMNFYVVTDMRIRGGYSRVMPQSYLGKMNYFSVFSAETIDKIEGDLSYTFNRRVRVLGDYTHYSYDEADDAERLGGGLEILWGVLRDNVLGGGYKRLDKDDNGYDAARGYLFQNLGPKLHVALNSTTYFLDEKIQNEDIAFDGDMSLGFKPTPRFIIQATGRYRSTPFLVDDEVQGLLKIAYNVERGL